MSVLQKASYSQSLIPEWYLQLPEKLIQAPGKTVSPEIYKLINSVWNKEDLPQQWKELITVPVHTMGDGWDWSN